MDFERFKRRRSRKDVPRYGNIEVGRDASKRPATLAEVAQSRYAEDMEAIKLSGYRFLRPPGVSKTLKNLQEEELYHREYSSSAFSEGPASGAFRSQEELSPQEHAASDSGSDENLGDNFDYTPDMSLPTMNASLPSMYLPPP